MPIKDLPLHLRPREKAALKGMQSLNEIELLAIFIKNGNKNKSALDVSRDLISKYKTFKNMSNANMKELMLFDAIGKVKALEIMALFEFSKRIKSVEPSTENFKDEKNLIKFAQSQIGSSKSEEFLIVLFDKNHELISYKILYKGTGDSLLIDVKGVVKESIIAQADMFYCFHNHPSGNPKPSGVDVMTTKRLRNYSELLDIEMKKHYVITSDDYQEI